MTKKEMDKIKDQVIKLIEERFLLRGAELVERKELMGRRSVSIYMGKPVYNADKDFIAACVK